MQNLNVSQLNIREVSNLMFHLWGLRGDATVSRAVTRDDEGLRGDPLGQDCRSQHGEISL